MVAKVLLVVFITLLWSRHGVLGGCHTVVKQSLYSSSFYIVAVLGGC